MKYAISYSKPHSTRVRRTRFVGKNMAKRKRVSLKQRGFETSIIPRTELEEQPKDLKAPVNPRQFNSGMLWRFVPKYHKGEYLGLICIKNGKNKALHNLP